MLFFGGLAIVLLEVLGLGGYMLAQQGQAFLEVSVLILVIGGVNLAAIVMMLVGLFKE